MADSLIPEWLDSFATQDAEDTANMVDGLESSLPDVEGAQPAINLPGIGQAAQQPVGAQPMLPGMTPQTPVYQPMQEVAQPVQQAMAQPAQQPVQQAPQQPIQQPAPIDPSTGLTAEEQAELDMLLQSQQAAPQEEAPLVGQPTTEMLPEYADEQDGPMILPETQASGGT